eukprot:g28192.t1
MLFLQFTYGVVVTLEEAQDGHVTQGVRGAVKMVDKQKVLFIGVYRDQMLCKSVMESALVLTNVEETTSGAKDTVDQIGLCTGESLSNLERLFGGLDGGFACTSSNLVYCICCSRCGLLYISETKHRLGDRFVEHLCSVRYNQQNLLVANHFNSPSYSLSDMSILGLLQYHNDAT